MGKKLAVIKNETEYSISFWFLFVLSIFSLSSVYSAYSVFAAVIHELAHILVLKFFGGKMKCVKLKLTDIDIRYDQSGFNAYKNILVSLSGPAINILLYFCLIEVNYHLAMSNLVIGIFNLLPIATLDGGNILKYIFKDNQDKFIPKLISFSFCFIIFLIGIYLLFINKYNFSLLIISLFLLYTNIQEYANLQ